MAISRFSTSRVGAGLPKYQKLWDGTTAVYTPPVATPSLWLDANASGSFTYSSSNVISQWRDLSGNNRHFSQATTASQPTLQTGVINSKPVVRFDAVNDNMATTEWVASNRTYFFVFRNAASITSATTNSLGLIQGYSTFPFLVIGLGNQTGSISGETASYLGVSTGGAQIRGRYIGSTIAAGNHQLNLTTDSSYVGTLRLDKTATTTTVSPNGDLTSTVYPAYVGQIDGGTLGLDMAEVLIYDRVLSGSEITTVESYLATKWGV